MSGARQKICNETILVQKVVYIQSNFAFVFLNNALPHRQVTMIRLWPFALIFEAILHIIFIFFAENAKVRKTVRRKNYTFNNF